MICSALDVAVVVRYKESITFPEITDAAVALVLMPMRAALVVVPLLTLELVMFRMMLFWIPLLVDAAKPPGPKVVAPNVVASAATTAVADTMLIPAKRALFVVSVDVS